MKRLMVGLVVAFGLAAMGTPAFATSGEANQPGSGVQTTADNCPLLKVPALMATELPDPSNDDLRIRVGQMMSLGGPALRAAGSKALDGTTDDIRALVDSGWKTAYKHDLRIAVGRLMTASHEVYDEVQDLLDADTVEGYEQFLARENCTPRVPSTPPAEPAAPANPAVAPPATPVPAIPTVTG